MFETVFLQLSLMALTLCMIGGTPWNVQVQKRLFIEDAMDVLQGFRGQLDKTVDGVRDWWSNTKTSDEDMELGQEMIDRGQHLLELAANLSQQAYDGVTDPQTRQRIKDALDAVTKAATDVINAGHKVVQNKGKITAAIKQTYKEVGDAVQVSFQPLQDSLRLTKESIQKAGPALAAAGISAKNSAVALAGALNEMVETSDLVARANSRLEAVGKNLWNFGKGLVDAGRRIGSSLGDGAVKVAKASGLWDKGYQDKQD